MLCPAALCAACILWRMACCRWASAASAAVLASGVATDCVAEEVPDEEVPDVDISVALGPQPASNAALNVTRTARQTVYIFINETFLAPSKKSLREYFMKTRQEKSAGMY